MSTRALFGEPIIDYDGMLSTVSDIFSLCNRNENVLEAYAALPITGFYSRYTDPQNRNRVSRSSFALLPQSALQFSPTNMLEQDLYLFFAIFFERFYFSTQQSKLCSPPIPLLVSLLITMQDWCAIRHKRWEVYDWRVDTMSVICKEFFEILVEWSNKFETCSCHRDACMEVVSLSVNLR